MSNKENPYQLFSKEILANWISQSVTFLKVEELSVIDGVTFFELIPDSELLDAGEVDTLYPIDSEDVEEMLLPSPKVRFVVHDIYLEEEE